MTTKLLKLLLPYKRTLEARKLYNNAIKEFAASYNLTNIKDEQEDFDYLLSKKVYDKLMLNGYGDIYEIVENIVREENPELSEYEDIPFHMFACVLNSDTYLNYDDPDCQYDTDIITELKPLLLPLKPVLEESSDYPEEEVNKTFDFALVIVDNIAHKYGERGQYFLDWWGNTDGTIDLVDQIANGTL